MFDRQRRDTDEIEFDFFDDSPTSDVTTAPPARRRRRIPTGPPGRGAPLVRLAALIAGFILLGVVLVLWASSCREGQRRGQYEDYMDQVASVGRESAQIGAELNQLISTPGKKLPDLRQEMEGLRQQQSQAVARAQALEPPGRLREQQESLVEALQLRVSGLGGLASALAQKASPRALAEQSNRLIASDVVYEDFFKAGATAVLEQEDLQGIPVPDSNFVKNRAVTSAQSWKLIVQRLTQTPAAGGLHGNQIERVVVEPGGKTLTQSADNTVKSSDRLTFQVFVKNSGNSQEAQVKVNLTIQQSPEPIRKSGVIDLIDPGETVRVSFGDLGPVSFGTRTTIKVTVEPVVGETNTNNNTADYRVIFTL